MWLSSVLNTINVVRLIHYWIIPISILENKKWLHQFCVNTTSQSQNRSKPIASTKHVSVVNLVASTKAERFVIIHVEYKLRLILIVNHTLVQQVFFKTPPRTCEMILQFY